MRQDDAGVLLSLAGYSTVCAKAAGAIRTGLDVEISAANLFDKNYELYPGFRKRVASVWCSSGIGSERSQEVDSQ